MNTCNQKSVRPGENRWLLMGKGVTYRDLYEAIDKRQDLSAQQLFYLSRLVARKLKAFDPRLDSRELEMKPYAKE